MEVALLTLILMSPLPVRPSSLTCSEDGRYVAVVDTARELTLFRRADWSVVAEFGEVRSRMVEARGNGFAVFDEEGLMRFGVSGEVLERRPFQRVSPPAGRFWFRTSPSGRFLAVRGEAGVARIWDAMLTERLSIADWEGAQLMVWSENERWMLVGSLLSQPFVEGAEAVAATQLGVDAAGTMADGAYALLSSEGLGESELTLWGSLGWPPDVRWTRSFSEDFNTLAVVDDLLVLGSFEGDLRVVSRDGEVLADRPGATDGDSLRQLAPCGPGTVLSLSGAERRLRAWSVEELMHGSGSP